MKQSKNAKPDTKAVEKLDLDPDAWPRFEALVKNAAKMGHKPHNPPKGVKARAKTAKNRPTKPRQAPV